eukprot:SAG22_NODE_7047_length_782_cov_1.084919_1_plen_212_part_10
MGAGSKAETKAASTKRKTGKKKKSKKPEASPELDDELAEEEPTTFGTDAVLPTSKLSERKHSANATSRSATETAASSSSSSTVGGSLFGGGGGEAAGKAAAGSGRAEELNTLFGALPDSVPVQVHKSRPLQPGAMMRKQKQKQQQAGQPQEIAAVRDDHVNDGWKHRQAVELAAKKSEADPVSDAQKDLRTVFVGHLPTTVQRKRLLQVFAP